jgi:hypothetical protein
VEARIPTAGHVVVAFEEETDRGVVEAGEHRLPRRCQEDR